MNTNDTISAQWQVEGFEFFWTSPRYTYDFAAIGKTQKYVFQNLISIW